MIDFFCEKINISKERFNLVAILVVFSVILFFLLDKYWISPDEYFYVDIGRSMASAYQGSGCFHCIDTAHTPLVSFIISLGYHFFGINSLMVYRIIPTVFSIGTLYVLYKIGSVAFKKKSDAFLIFLIILLFPGFITFANKIYLDIFALFFISLVLYLLLIREKYWKIGLALLLVFLSKDYLFIFPGAIILLVILFDAFGGEQASFLQKIKKIFFAISVSFLPSIAAAFIFLTTTIVPYPRMLENLFIEILGPAYWHFANIFHGTIPESAIVGDSKSVLASIVKLNIVDITRDATLMSKIKEIYLSSYQEIDVNLLVLPLFFIGLATRLKFLVSNLLKNKYGILRNDFIFLAFLLIVVYFNFRVSSGDHGFRIIFPLILPFTFYIYWALRELLEKDGYWYKFSFAVLSFLFIFFYFQTNNSEVSYNSVISGNGIIAVFLKYKVYLNIILYAILACIILFYGRINMRYKVISAILFLMFLCAYKIIPFAVDKHFANIAYGNNYELNLSSQYLEKIEKENPIVMTNEIPYAYYYYANKINLPNEDSPTLPVIRKKPETIYTNKLIYLNKGNLSMDYICQKKVDYIFYVHTDEDDIMLNERMSEFSFLLKISEHRLAATQRFSWGLYVVDKNACNK